MGCNALMINAKIRNIFWVAGLYNIAGVLIFSVFFTNPYLAEYDPLLFSHFGLIAIILWGLAYIAVATSYPHVRPLMFVFTIEKGVYFICWIGFLITNGNSLPEIFDKSIMTGLFFSVYGLGDFIFGCFFAWVGLKGYKPRSPY